MPRAARLGLGLPQTYPNPNPSPSPNPNPYQVGSVQAEGGKAHAPEDQPSLDCLTRISVKQPKKKKSDVAYHRVPGHEASDFSP